MFFNKEKIKSNFNNHAQKYDKNAILQNIVAKKLIGLAIEEVGVAKNIIDLGSGSGFVSKEISANKIINKNIFELDFALKSLLFSNSKKKKLLSINADIESLPIKPDIFDLALSSMSLQWINNLGIALNNVFHVLKPKSSFIFSILTDGTLRELTKSCKSLNVNLAINNFIKLKNLEKLLENSNFNSYNIIELDEVKLYHKDIFQLIKSIKNIGASYSNRNSIKIIKKSDFENLNQFYLKNFNSNGKIKASWNVAYVKISKL